MVNNMMKYIYTHGWQLYCMALNYIMFYYVMLSHGTHHIALHYLAIHYTNLNNKYEVDNY